MDKLVARCRSSEYKSSKTCPILRAPTFCLVKIKKPLDLQVLSRIGKTMKRLPCIPNTILHGGALLVVILIMFTYLTASKLFYLLMDCETFN